MAGFTPHSVRKNPETRNQLNTYAIISTWKIKRKSCYENVSKIDKSTFPNYKPAGHRGTVKSTMKRRIKSKKYNRRKGGKRSRKKYPF